MHYARAGLGNNNVVVHALEGVLMENLVDKYGALTIAVLTRVTIIAFCIIAFGLTIGGCLGIIGFHW